MNSSRFHPTPGPLLLCVALLTAPAIAERPTATTHPAASPYSPAPNRWLSTGEDQPHLSDLRLNQLQVIGTHNSYKCAIQPELFAQLRLMNPNTARLDYHHRPLPQQLALGVRNLELDLYYDPVGGHYAAPLGLKLLRIQGITPLPFNVDGEPDAPGFKVLHDCNIDYRSHTPRLEDTLAGLRYWSARHPRHLPIFVTLNLKGGDAPAPGAIDPIEWDAAALDALDRALLIGLGRENLLVPDTVRASHANRTEAITRTGWPSVAACRGKFIFIMDQGGRLRQTYLKDHPDLRGRVMFTSSPDDASDAVILIVNDPQRHAKRIEALVRRGRIVRTRADAGTQEIRAGDLRRFAAAQACGAQIITTDYPEPDRRHHPTYQVVFPDGRYARANPLTAPADPSQSQRGR